MVRETFNVHHLALSAISSTFISISSKLRLKKNAHTQLIFIHVYIYIERKKKPNHSSLFFIFAIPQKNERALRLTAVPNKPHCSFSIYIYVYARVRKRWSSTSSATHEAFAKIGSALSASLACQKESESDTFFLIRDCKALLDSLQISHAPAAVCTHDCHGRSVDARFCNLDFCTRGLSNLSPAGAG